MVLHGGRGQTLPRHMSMSQIEPRSQKSLEHIALAICIFKGNGKGVPWSNGFKGDMLLAPHLFGYTI